MNKLLPKGTLFYPGSGKHKYKVVIPSETSKKKTIQFGHRDYEHFKDSVPKSMGGGLWTDKNHGDLKRRKNYRTRHSKIMLLNGSLAYEKKFSPSWFSFYFLW